MFGYIKPMVSELRVREHELYKAVYCGLCRAMGEHICSSNRLTLSYDIVFLALVRAGVQNEDIHVEKGRCLAHPIKKRNHAFIPETLKYCSRVSAILTYYNVEDDVKDSKGFASFKHRLLLPSAKKFLRKADMPQLAQIMEADLKELSDMEDHKGSLDSCAECFGALLGKVFAQEIASEDIKNNLYELGYHVGKWIYIIDAADDFEKDKKNGEYNPLATFDELPVDMLSVAATLELKAAFEAVSNITISNQALSSIINNILTLGMPDVQKNIIGELE